eukprot:gnl/MRDRNA2_/MRDRNA2_428651_c0_seq1.p1 gnl/MRDRNA2_/MRDRNA2_428651_c0~~gnl/MRDRNA2_/MRDRNA2_428651_c0_seq1.p1  ORF type:complete len:133 (+),score=20.34 gnl/MRDRNA2_/MRDRNA2_428651_c0_seq1:373-771(+)
MGSVMLGADPDVAESASHGALNMLQWTSSAAAMEVVDGFENFHAICDEHEENVTVLTQDVEALKTGQQKILAELKQLQSNMMLQDPWYSAVTVRHSLHIRHLVMVMRLHKTFGSLEGCMCCNLLVVRTFKCL